MTTRYIGLKEFRNNIGKIALDARKKHQNIIILRKNVPLCELVPLTGDDEGVYKPEFVAKALKARSRIGKGRSYTSDEVRKKLGL